jgi:hypothetical protein
VTSAFITAGLLVPVALCQPALIGPPRIAAASA